MKKNAIGFDKISISLHKDDKKFFSSFGKRIAENSPWNFIVRFSGIILSVNNTLSSGTILVDILPLDGKADLELQIGPIIKGSPVHDSLSFISFGDFKSQIDYGKFYTYLNKYI